LPTNGVFKKLIINYSTSEPATKTFTNLLIASKFAISEVAINRLFIDNIYIYIYIIKAIKSFNAADLLTFAI
jgi:hypothetical protein